MDTLERMTITVTPEMAKGIREAIKSGYYASTSELIRDALRDWKLKRELQSRELLALREELERGQDDIDAGRVHDFDTKRIVEKGEEKLAARKKSK